MEAIKKELLFATNNSHKLAEVESMLNQHYKLLSLKEVSFSGDIPEPFETLEENAIHKAKILYEHCKIPCFADDTGLEVEALNGEPGVYSARYAGAEKSAEANMNKLLKELDGKENRNAQFRTVVAYVNGESIHTFNGIVKGVITKQKSGTGGFGYDPIFKPNDFDLTFSEMDAAKKNEISHRARAIKKFVLFLGF